MTRRCPIAFRLAPLTAALVCALSTGALAASDPYHITASEKAACTPDAARLCSDAYPDEGRLLGCMKANHASLSSVCKVAFNAGLKRRHLR